MTLVVDASCLVKLVGDEPGSAEFRAWFTTGAEAEGPLEAPDILWYEFGRALQRAYAGKKSDLQAEVHRRALARVRLVTPGRAGVFRVAARGVSFYDASYLALARERSAEIVTADRAMQRLARALDIPVRPF